MGWAGEDPLPSVQCVLILRLILVLQIGCQHEESIQAQILLLEDHIEQVLRGRTAVHQARQRF